MIIYLLTVLPNFQIFFNWAAAIFAFGVVCPLIYLFIKMLEESFDDVRPGCWTALKISIPCFLLAVCGSCFVPTEKQMVIIVAGNYLKDSDLAKLPEDASAYIRTYIQKAKLDLEESLKKPGGGEDKK